ncbi:MAG: sodium:calcium antiporter [Chloroflexota bacterium]
MTLGDGAWLCAFLVSLAAVLAASDRLVRVVEAAGDHFDWPPGLVGLIAAAGADGPEVTAAIISLIKGQHAVSLGVILGSNLFNLAALLGLPILLVGFVGARRHVVVLNGTTLVVITVLATLLVAGKLPVLLVEGLVAAVLVAYAAALLHGNAGSAAGLGGTSGSSGNPDDGETEEQRARAREEDAAQGFPPGRRLLLVGLLATAVVIGGCTVLVSATLELAPVVDLPRSWTGTFGLAILTSLPNVWVALALARRGRGAVLVSAVCNSNTINMTFGICLPALFTAMAPSVTVLHLDLPALLLLSVLAIALIWRNRGLGRRAAACLVAIYLVYAVIRTVMG